MGPSRGAAARAASACPLPRARVSHCAPPTPPTSSLSARRAPAANRDTEHSMESRKPSLSALPNQPPPAPAPSRRATLHPLDPPRAAQHAHKHPTRTRMVPSRLLRDLTDIRRIGPGGAGRRPAVHTPQGRRGGDRTYRSRAPSRRARAAAHAASPSLCWRWQARSSSCATNSTGLATWWRIARSTAEATSLSSWCFLM